MCIENVINNHIYQSHIYPFPYRIFIRLPMLRFPNPRYKIDESQHWQPIEGMSAGGLDSLGNGDAALGWDQWGGNGDWGASGDGGWGGGANGSWGGGAGGGGAGSGALLDGLLGDDD